MAKRLLITCTDSMMKQFLEPHVLHLMRGQIFEIDGKKIFTFGGASSHDITGGILETDDPSFKEKKKARLSGRRILLAEDVDINAEILIDLLAGTGDARTAAALGRFDALQELFPAEGLASSDAVFIPESFRLLDCPDGDEQ